MPLSYEKILQEIKDLPSGNRLIINGYDVFRCAIGGLEVSKNGIREKCTAARAAALIFNLETPQP